MKTSKPIPPENFRKPLVFEISEDVPQGLEKKKECLNVDEKVKRGW